MVTSNSNIKPELINPEALVRIINQEQEHRKVGILADSNTATCCLPALVNAGLIYQPEHIYIVKAGERSKSPGTLNRIHKWMLGVNLQRSDLLLNLGGGMITDLGGFSASIYMRGIEFMNVPTSLLGMVDASIGGKTGINLENHKNYLGTFAEPKYIYICHSFLYTLPKKEWRSGLAEMIKHAVLNMEYDWLRDLGNSRSSRLVDLSAEEILRSASFKLKIVQQDPRENGVRKILNFGHTVGHAIEKVFSDTKRKIRHGDAVACGMYVAIRLSERILQFDAQKSRQLQELLTKYFPKLRILPKDIHPILSTCYSDKKNFGSNLSFVLLDVNGHPKFNVQVDPELVRSELQAYCNL